jgi:outer membrane protein TolC
MYKVMEHIMKKWRDYFITAAFFSLFWVVPALFAQEGPRYDLPGGSGPVRKLSPDEAVDLAIKNNLGLESARISADTKKRASDLRWNAFIPTVEIGGTLGRLNEAPQGTTIMGMTFGGGPQWRLSGSLSATLNLNIATFESMKKTRLDYEAGLISVEKARLQLERDVRKAYFNILFAEEQIKLLNDSLANAQRRVDMAQANYRAGLIPEVSVLQARVAVENLRPTINEVENGHRMAMASFAMYLGLPYDTQFALNEISEDVEFIALNTAELISKAALDKPELAELKKNLQSLQSTRKSTFFNLYTPTLSLGYTMDPTFGGDPWKDNIFDSSLWNQSSGMFRITLGWRLNGLFPFTQEHQALKSLDDSIRAANVGLAQAVQGAEVEVYNIVLQLEKTRTQAEAQRLTVELAERTYLLSEQAYRSGIKEFLDVQNDELALRQARLNLLQQNYAYLTGLLDLEYAIGVPFGSLEEKK